MADRLAASFLHLTAGLALTVVLLAGCQPAGPGSLPEAVWGRHGVSEGRFEKPRAMAIDGQQRLFIVDMTARIQAFDLEGNFLFGWQTPEHEHGKPTGLSIARNGDVWVADTHYYRLLRYSPRGELKQTIGGKPGPGPGQFGLVTHVIEDPQGNYYVAEYGDWDRIQKFAPDGRFLLQWGGHGSEPGQFLRPAKMAWDAQQHIWVADACNHRVQVFDTQGKLLHYWGAQGAAAGQLYYPYDLTVAPDGTVYVCEFGNHRLQRFTADGRSLGCWGSWGREPGQLNNPWALARDAGGRFYVLDTGNHRVQRLRW